jgi:hypothetical protein
MRDRREAELGDLDRRKDEGAELILSLGREASERFSILFIMGMIRVKNAHYPINTAMRAVSTY